MPDALSLDPVFLEQRRRLVAQRRGVFGLEQAAATPLGDGTWELRLQFIPAQGGEEPGSIPPLLTAGNLRLAPLAPMAPMAPIAPMTPAGESSMAESFLIQDVRPADGPDTVTVLLRGPADPAALRRYATQWQVELTGVPGLDPLFSQARFNLLLDTPSSLPPAAPHQPWRLPQHTPAIDYLAKDYASFRREMLDDLTAWVPDLVDDSVAAQNIAVVELLAFAGDYLSYYQDAVGTEAYLGTARRRVSVARHAQLLDYFVTQGTNSRVWVKLLVDVPSGPAAVVPAGTALLTSVPGLSGPVISDQSQLQLAVNRGARVFETLEDLEVDNRMNEIRLYAWGLEDFSIPAGSTEAPLCGTPPDTLRPGRVLTLEEAGSTHHRHAVRLTAVAPARDPVTGEAVTVVRWAPEEALPFPLPVARRGQAGLGIACGNVVLADFGATLPLSVPGGGPPRGMPLPPVPGRGRYRPRLAQDGLIFSEPYDPVAAQARPAVDALHQDPARAAPAIDLRQTTLGNQEQAWTARRTLFESGRFAPDFVVEMEDGREASLLFGDGRQGQRPAPGSVFAVRYRVGFGNPNIGRDALAHVVTDKTWQTWIQGVENPIPASGAALPERTRRAALFAPHAYQSQERCVTPADYAAVLESYPDVLHARVELCSTGSWTTAFVYVQLRGGRALGGRRRARLAAALAARTLAGTDFELRGPVYLPVFAAFRVQVAPWAIPASVQQALWQVFGSFFAPDSFTFGQPLYLSRMVETAMAVPGVADVTPLRFATWGQPPGQPQLAAGAIVPGADQIVLLRNDPDRPGGGELFFEMQGGQ